MSTSSKVANIWLHRFAIVVAGSTWLLIFIGGLVTSTGSGLAVPDWPNTYGHFMFSFPLSQMVGGILYEHGHRLAASMVGLFTTILAIWLWLTEPRRWLKWLGVASLLAVIAQGILGGVTVLFLLPTPVSVLHACLAQTFFCMTICLAFFTSPEFQRKSQRVVAKRKASVHNLAMLTTASVFLQLILGAIMRHTGSGLAIPDFPLAFGKIIPPIHTQAIAIHFLHRVGAVIVTASVLWTAYRILRHHRDQARLVKPALVLVTALICQIVLAAFTIWTQKGVLPTTAHVATGAFILGNCLFLTLRASILLNPAEQSLKAGYAYNSPVVS